MKIIVCKVIQTIIEYIIVNYTTLPYTMSSISNLNSAHGFVDIYCGLVLLCVISSPRVVQGYTQTFEIASAEMIRMIGYIMLLTGSAFLFVGGVLLFGGRNVYEVYIESCTFH